MANLLTIAELAARTIYPNPSPTQIIVFVEQAKIQYAAAMWLFSKETEATEGGFEMPSTLLSEIELEVIKNEIDLSELNILNSLSMDRGIQDIGGMNCECKYVKSSLNQEKMLCNDDSMGDDVKPFYIVGKKIKFPQGTHKDNKLTIIYANMGEGINPKEIECNEYVGAKVMDKLMQLYGTKFPEDKTINNSSNN